MVSKDNGQWLWVEIDHWHDFDNLSLSDITD